MPTSPTLSVVPGSAVGSVGKASARTIDPLDEIWFRKPKRRHVFEFTETLALVFLIIGASRAYHYDVPTCLAWVTAAAVILAIGAWFPRILLPVWRSWMLLAEYISRVSTAVILSVLWMLMIAPIAVVLRLVGKSVLDTDYRKAGVDSYWKVRSDTDTFFKHMQRQF